MTANPAAPSRTTADTAPYLWRDDAMPRYADDAALWVGVMRRRLVVACEKREINMTGAQTAIVELTLSRLEKIGKLGDEREAFKIADEEIDKRQLTALAMTWKGVPRSALHSANDVSEWAKDHYKATKNQIREMFVAAGLGGKDMERVQWISNVHHQLEQCFFNRNGQYNMHWFNTSASTAVMIHYHSECDRHSIDLRQRSRTLNQILKVGTPFLFPGTGADARTLIDAHMAALPAVATTAATDTLDGVFGPKRDAEVEKMPGDKRNWSAFWTEIKTVWAEFDIPEGTDKDAVIHDCAGVPTQSLKMIPLNVANGELVAKIKVGLKARYSLKAIEQESNMAQTSTKPTLDEWVAWQKQNFPDVPFTDEKGGPNILRFLNAASEKAKQGPVTKLSEWNDTLIEASRAVVDGLKIEQPVGATTPPTPPTDDATTISVPADSAIVSDPAITQVATPASMPMMPIGDPVRVYPLPGASYIYEGVTWAVSLGLGGTMDMADTLCDQWLLRRDRIAPTCFVDNQRKPEVFDPDLKHEECFAIKRVSTPEAKEAMYTLYFNLANGEEAGSPLKIYPSGKNRDVLEVALKEAGINPESMRDGARMPLDITAEYRKGAEVKGGLPGARYNDFVKFIINAPATAKAS